ncbi:hypothetical protein [Ileibacterium valens]|uniref:hypothetical protein n=1 Tax=Ileibacterium valens TaxID=1862668 RepID=UPI0025744D31|nr:hypothetical protein [Ileibacterium valens]
MTTDAQKRARNNYNTRKLTNKTVSFNKNTESDLLRWLENKPFGPYVKKLIKEDMEKQAK